MGRFDYLVKENENKKNKKIVFVVNERKEIRELLTIIENKNQKIKNLENEIESLESLIIERIKLNQ